MQDLQGMWTSHKKSIHVPSCTNGWLRSSSHYKEKTNMQMLKKKAQNCREVLFPFPQAGLVRLSAMEKNYS